MNTFYKLLLFIPFQLYCQKEAYELLEKAKLSLKDPDKSMEFLIMAQKSFLITGNQTGLMEVENLKVEIYDRKGDKHNKYWALKELEKYAIALNSIEKQLKSYKILFEFFISLEMYDSALIYNEKIKYLGEKHGFSEDITNVNGYLGSFYTKLKKYELAKEYLLKSLQLKADKNKTALLSELGNNYYYLQKYDSAFYYYTLANEKANFFKDTLGIAYTLNNLGLYYKAKGDFSTAINYFQNAIIFYQNINNRYGIINSHSNIAQIYFLEKKYSAAIEICLKFYQEAKENESYELIFELSKVLAESYEKLKNYEKSVIYYKEFIIAKDSIFQSKFKMLNSDYEHKLLILQNKKEHNWKDFIDIWFYLFVLIFLISILLVIFIIWITKKYEIRWSRIINS